MCVWGGGHPNMKFYVILHFTIKKYQNPEI